MRFRKILCAVDFSQGSERAMAVATRLATQLDVPLELLHAWHLPPTLYSTELMIPGDIVQQLRDDAERALEGALAHAKELGAAHVTSKLLVGVPWATIVDAADDLMANLIVVGTHGRTGLPRVLLGSVAEKVLRHAPCSVMVVRPDSTPRPFARILCPVDFSDSSRRAIELAAMLAKPGGDGLTLLHIVDGVGPPGLVGELDKSASALLERWAAELRTTTAVPVRTQTCIGHPGAELLGALDHDRTIDLVAMGSHGRTGIKRALLGSVAEKVARHAHCPVLVARANPSA